MLAKRRSGGVRRPFLAPGYLPRIEVRGDQGQRVVAATYAPGSVASEPYQPGQRLPVRGRYSVRLGGEWCRLVGPGQER